ncbi:TetR/AcrR family transcriptional regulator [Bacillus sp. DNRA2]|uniref:TetR/AcrR family transcriptional regulator n=1 Tax=Bacillus sp. DNRA2 TaxID=2723053 RepID=UPI00145DCFCF|nr:TetR/AcrR family transcriptional regulator [Bacillus sp. DNRA2]NMD72697.1 TetR/AcrR family transcriptional regulator [Bacillus sp. DNRA2]
MIKKQLIMEKALELIAKQGFEATTVQQITDYCGISKGAFYLSFKSKDELILALIDHFMMQFISDIDQIVRSTQDENLLYEFYYSIYDSFQKHSDFAKVLMKEQTSSLNEQLIIKLQHYDRLLEVTILSMVERLYGDQVQESKYDLMFCIKAFMNTYSHLFLFYNIPVDLHLLAQSLVEKTDLLAKQTSTPFITKEMIQILPATHDQQDDTVEQIKLLIKQKIAEMDESIEKESLILLKEQLEQQTYSRAIIKGLLENIRNQPHCKWIAYLLYSYYHF